MVSHFVHRTETRIFFIIVLARILRTFPTTQFIRLLLFCLLFYRRLVVVFPRGISFSSFACWHCFSPLESDSRGWSNGTDASVERRHDVSTPSVGEKNIAGHHQGTNSHLSTHEAAAEAGRKEVGKRGEIFFSTSLSTPTDVRRSVCLLATLGKTISLHQD